MLILHIVEVEVCHFIEQMLMCGIKTSHELPHDFIMKLWHVRVWFSRKSLICTDVLFFVVLETKTYLHRGTRLFVCKKAVWPVFYISDVADVCSRTRHDCSCHDN